VPRPLPSIAVLSFLVCALSILVAGCGDGASTEASGDSGATTSPPTPAADSRQEAADRGGEEGVLASSACKALPLSAAEGFDSRFVERSGGGDASGLSGCHYDTLDEESGPPATLILELVPSPAEASESAAKTICREIIEEIERDPTYEDPEPVPALGEESSVVAGFSEADPTLHFDEDETIFVADWRQDGSCARLIYSASGSVPVPTLDEFVALAERVSASGEHTRGGD
jgi:hypothetical protein